MFRYLLFADGTSKINQDTMTTIEADKRNGWKVSDAISVRIISTNDGFEETPDPNQGVPGCKIVLS